MSDVITTPESVHPHVQQVMDDDHKRPTVEANHTVQPRAVVELAEQSPRSGGGHEGVPAPVDVPGQLSVGKPDVEADGASGGLSNTPDHPKGVTRRKCEYERGGYCVFHGMKGVKKFKPSWVTRTGPDGKTERKYKKKYEYVCELKGGMVQPRLSFTKTTLKNDVKKTVETTVNTFSDFTTCTEGQSGSYYTGQAGDVLDEKKQIDEKFD